MKIAWIGTGIMGTEMLLHLHQAGHELHVFNRTKEKAKRLERPYLIAYSSIKECIKDCEVIFTMVGYPSDVETIYQNELFPHAAKGNIFIDMTTSSPHLASTLYESAKALGYAMLDAPVSGGDSGAKQASLSIMVGGDYETFQKIFPLFSLMGKEICYMGKAGNGQHTKAANQIAVAGAVAAMSEAIHYMRMNDLVETDALQVISHGAAGSWQLEHTAPKVINEDFNPGFFIKHFIKDMKIVQEVMAKQHQQLPMLDTVCELYETLVKAGYQDAGTQALIKYYEK